MQQAGGGAVVADDPEPSADVVPVRAAWGDDVMLYDASSSALAGCRRLKPLGSKVGDGPPEVAAFNGRRDGAGPPGRRVGSASS